MVWAGRLDSTQPAPNSKGAGAGHDLRAWEGMSKRSRQTAGGVVHQAGRSGRKQATGKAGQDLFMYDFSSMDTKEYTKSGIKPFFESA